MCISAAAVPCAVPVVAPAAAVHPAPALSPVDSMDTAAVTSLTELFVELYLQECAAVRASWPTPPMPTDVYTVCCERAFDTIMHRLAPLLQ